GGLVQGTDGNFYGATNFGGNGTDCQTSCGTIFKITAAGKLTTLYDFSTTQGPYGPYGGLVRGTDGNFYGTTQANMVFQITPAGLLTPLFTFDFEDGFEPLDAPVQGTNGTFYGTTYQGASGYGTIFSLSMGLGPFVETNPTSGKVGGKVTILGNNLTGATAVTFNGTAAKFKIVSSSEITAIVPAGATTGKVGVTTSTETLESNVAFRVAH
ncbi:MAG TPA: choice-of-anchor tandem repeat GloVer-containing protein, partial [Terracidiphilus sp.]